jgi:hypothetical protein
MTTARTFGSLTEAADAVSKRAAELRSSGNDTDPIDLYKVLSSYDAALAKAITIGDEGRQTAAARRDKIAELLADHFPVLEMFATGSLMRGTGLKGVSDVDVIAVLHYAKDVNGKSPAERDRPADLRPGPARHRPRAHANGRHRPKCGTGVPGPSDGPDRGDVARGRSARSSRASDGRGDRIRTCDILLPKQARYQLRYTPKDEHPSITAGGRYPRSAAARARKAAARCETVAFSAIEISAIVRPGLRPNFSTRNSGS